MREKEEPKVTPLAGNDLKPWTKNEKIKDVSENSSPIRNHSTVAIFMTSPVAECTSREPENTRLWPNGDSLTRTKWLLWRMAHCTTGYFRTAEFILDSYTFTAAPVP